MVAASHDDIADWTPPSLTSLAVPPVFRLRPATPRDRFKFDRALVLEGLSYHDGAAVRAEHLRGLRSLSSPENYDADAAKLNEWWDSSDQGLELTELQSAALSTLCEDLARAWPPLRLMLADNRDFNRDAPRLAMGLYIVGWSGLETPFDRSGGVVPIEAFDALETELSTIEGKAKGIVGVEQGLAFIQLSGHVLSLMSLGRSAEENSASPQSPPSDPNGLRMTKSPAAAAGKSRARSTRKTRLAA